VRLLVRRVVSFALGGLYPFVALGLRVVLRGCDGAIGSIVLLIIRNVLEIRREMWGVVRASFTSA